MALKPDEPPRTLTLTMTPPLHSSILKSLLASIALLAGMLVATDAALAEPKAPLKELPRDVTRVAVVFSGGHDTEQVDHGRPVVLIAAALEVKPEAFREAFTHVHPAGPGSGGPTDGEARKNKAALMEALEKYGVTDDRLNTVSNFYRYPPGRGNLWKTKAAMANALVKNGVVIGYEIIDGGAGYSSAPTVTVPEIKGATAKVEITFGKDLETNGAVSAIRVSEAKAK